MDWHSKDQVPLVGEGHYSETTLKASHYHPNLIPVAQVPRAIVAEA